jgi:hypothetical protein
MRKYVSWAIAIALAFATASGAQDFRAQERVVDSAQARVVRAQARVNALNDSIARTMQDFDSLTVGPLRLLVHPRFRVLVEAAARGASAKLLADAPTQARRLTAARLAVRPWSDTTDGVLVFLTRPGHSDRMEAYIDSDSATLAGHFIAISERFLARSLDARLRLWSAATLLPDSITDGAWVGYRLDLVSANGVVARNCFGGDMRACMVTLGLTPTTDPVLEWYDAADRRAIIKREIQFRPHGYRVQSEQCIAGDDAACTDVLRNYTEFLRTPVLSEIRESLVSIALQLGGASAYDRLLVASGTPTQQIEAAATVPIDSVVRAWQRRIRETRLPSDSMNLQIAIGSLFWIGFCGALSLRSTRWR